MEGSLSNQEFKGGSQSPLEALLANGVDSVEETSSASQTLSAEYQAGLTNFFATAALEEKGRNLTKQTVSPIWLDSHAVRETWRQRGSQDAKSKVRLKILPKTFFLVTAEKVFQIEKLAEAGIYRIKRYNPLEPGAGLNEKSFGRSFTAGKTLERIEIDPETSIALGLKRSKGLPLYETDMEPPLTLNSGEDQMVIDSPLALVVLNKS